MLAGFQLWRNTPEADIIPVGELAVRQADNGKLEAIQFQYLNQYLRNTAAIALDPVHAPLQTGLLNYDTDGRSLPGFIDDVLPDSWGQRVLAAVLKKKYLDAVTLLTHAGTNLTGDLTIQPLDGDPPEWAQGIDLQEIQGFVADGWRGDIEYSLENIEYISMLQQGGSGAGGARPKLLVNDDGQEWLYKFNGSDDPFDVAEAEYHCMAFAKAAGLNVPECELTQIGERRCLRLKRFDVSETGGRYRMLTMNALLKNKYTQSDPMHGSYKDISNLIVHHSISPEEDVMQLFGQMLVNGITGNTDDHLRNFSFIHRGEGWQLSPAYDIVPALEKNAFHQIDMHNSPVFPGIDKALDLGKHLGLSTSDANTVIEKVCDVAYDFGFDAGSSSSFGLRPK